MALITIKSRILRWGIISIIAFLVALLTDYVLDGARFSALTVLKDIGIVLVIFTILYFINHQYEKADQKRKARSNN